jgi:hypothetical protein
MQGKRKRKAMEERSLRVTLLSTPDEIKSYVDRIPGSNSRTDRPFLTSRSVQIVLLTPIFVPKSADGIDPEGMKGRRQSCEQRYGYQKCSCHAI